MIETDGQLTTLRESLFGSIESLSKLVTDRNANTAFFPYGVNKIAVRGKVGAAELSIEVEGPEKGPSVSDLLDLLAKRAAISFGPNGEGTLSYGGTSVPCLGNTTVKYTKDLTVRGELNVDKFRRRFSNEFGVWMEFAILIMGARGIYIHEGPDTLAGNGGESAGCIHLGSGNAERFWNWVDGPTRITIEYPW